jgi:predicted metal-dependent TIM-barrel fold hydrolase
MAVKKEIDSSIHLSFTDDGRLKKMKECGFKEIIIE